jgi:hypothetical protein
MPLASIVFLLAWQGVAPEWDALARAQKILAEAARLKAIVETLDANRWAAAGAPQILLDTRLQAISRLDQTAETARSLAREPNRAAASLQALLHLGDALEDLTTLASALRRYQSAAAADSFDSTLAGLRAERATLRRYVEELISHRESEMQVAEREAQRCREQLSRPAPRRPQPK